jgi:RNA polymerase sigma-70 factor (ECF subfamily)
VELYLFDADYVQRLRDGDSETEVHFVGYFRQLLRIKLRARYLSPDVIDDVQQETFIRVFRALRDDAIRQPERIGSYVNSVCNFVLQEHYRKQGKTNPSEDADTEIPDKVLNLEKLAITEEVNERVREAVKSLAPRERDLIRRIFFQEMEKDEVCAELGVSRDYLRVLMHRAIEHLREVLENKDLPPKSPVPEKKRK